MSGRTELVAPDDLRRAHEEIAGHLHVGDGRAAEDAMERYGRRTKALVVRATFHDAMQRQEGESLVDALRRAGRTTERVLDTVGDEDASHVVGELDPQVLGAVLSAAAGEASSSVVDLVDPTRIDEIFASDIELWTVARDGDDADRRSQLNTEHLVLVLYTLLQTDDDRAMELLTNLNPDLVAYPLAEALLDPNRTHHVDELDAIAAVEHEQEQEGQSDTETYLARLQALEETGPSALGIADGQLGELVEEIFRRSPEAYRAIVERARTLDLDVVRERLECDAADRASGGDVVTADEDDDMFEPYDGPASGGG